MNKSIEPGLKAVFVIGALGSLLTGGLSVLVPTFVTTISGLDAAAAPAIQNAGAATLGYFVMALMCLRATMWDQVRIVVAGSLTFTVLSTIGALYFVVLQGKTTLGFIVILLASIILTIGFAYYMFKYSKSA